VRNRTQRKAVRRRGSYINSTFRSRVIRATDKSANVIRDIKREETKREDTSEKISAAWIRRRVGWRIKKEYSAARNILSA